MQLLQEKLGAKVMGGGGGVNTLVKSKINIQVIEVLFIALRFFLQQLQIAKLLLGIPLFT